MAKFYLGLCSEYQGDIDKQDEYFWSARSKNYNLVDDLLKFEISSRLNYYKYPGYLSIFEQGLINALKIDSTNTGIMNFLADFYAEEGFNLQYAMQLAEGCLSEQPEFTDYLSTKAWILFRKGEVEQSYELILKVIELDHDYDQNREILYRMGKIQLALGKSSESIESFKKAYSLPEPGPWGMRLNEDMEQIFAELDH
jgi:tetratricopeptide (TPR) repeat protein